MDSEFEQTIERFEREFVDGKSPEIEDFLLGKNQSLLPELIHTELELKLTAGQSARVESYTDRFPSLAEDHQAVRELVLTEYNVRRNFDPTCRLEEYLLRFPQLKELLVEDFLSSSVGEMASDQHKQNLAVRPNSHSDVAARFHKRKLHEQGGLGNVWLARDTELQRDVAVKEIKAKFAKSRAHRNRFDREARVTGRLEHPGIVPVYGKGQSGSGSPFFAMQFVRGQNLKSRIKSFHENRREADDNSLDFNRLIQHFIDVCNTIEFAHSQGVVHRDIKPENVMIGQYGETFLIDWGLAFLKNDAQSEYGAVEGLNGSVSHDENQVASRDGQTIGSPAFMSPEQAKGDKSAIDVTSDIYSLGATLFSLLTNSSNPNLELANKSNRRTQHYRKGLARELYPLLSICDRAMAISPNERYASVQDLREDVESYLLDKSIVAHQDSLFEHGSRFLRRNRRVLNTALVSLVLISLLSALAAFWINLERNKAIAASAAESELRVKAEKMQGQEAESRARAEELKNKLTKIIGFFADALTGEDDAELNLDPASLTADSIITNLNRRVDADGDLIGQALMKMVIARTQKVRGKYGDAILSYSDAIELLEQEGISDSDPLYTNLLSGLCSANLAEGRMGETKSLVARIKEACKRNWEPLEETYFLTSVVEAEMYSRQLDNQNALRIAKEAVDLGNQVYVDSPGNRNLVWARYVLASAHRRANELDNATLLFEQIVANQESGEIPLPLEVASAVQLSELIHGKEPERAIELMEQASVDAVKVYGETHRDTIAIEARLGRLLARHEDPNVKSRGIEILEKCRRRQIESLGGNTHDEVLGTTLLLSKSLLANGDQKSAQRVVELLSKTVEELDDRRQQKGNRSIAFTAAFYDDLSAAYATLGNKTASLQAAQDAVVWAKKGYGESSPITVRLKEKLDERLEQQ